MVQSGGKYRTFTTERFTIRHFVRSMQRYGTEQKIVAMIAGIIPSSLRLEKWVTMDSTTVKKAVLSLKSACEVIWNEKTPLYSKQELLENSSSYRVAINTLYCQLHNSGEYPSEQPFSDTAIRKHPKGYNRLERPVFLADTDNKENHPSDILLLYNGYRLEKTINGLPVEGYILKNARW